MIQLFLPLSAITLRVRKGILRKEKAAGEQMKYKFTSVSVLSTYDP